MKTVRSALAHTPLVDLHGRGARSNRESRYDRHTHEVDAEYLEHQRQAEAASPPDADAGVGPGAEEAAEDAPLARLPTTVALEQARTIISRNQSPDVPFDRSINPYRGCEHGCVYCYARPSHAYLGLSPGLDFETRLTAKPNAARRLEEELSAPGYQPAHIALGANTDPYQPIEKEHGITREILQVLARFHHPVAITTKSALVLRDIDILAPMARERLVQVWVSVGCLDRRLARALEPRTATPQRRLETIRALNEAGIPASALVGPVIPGLTDPDLESILEAAAAAGARNAAYVLLRLPLELRDIFVEWLEEFVPLRAAHVMSMVRETRGGADNDSDFRTRMKGSGVYAQLLRRRFELARRRLGLEGEDPGFDCSRFRVPPKAGDQQSLF